MDDDGHLRPPDVRRLLVADVWRPIVAYAVLFGALSVAVGRRLPRSHPRLDPLQRQRLRNLVVSATHSALSGGLTLFALERWPELIASPLHFRQPLARHVQLLSVGYFVHDSVELLRDEWDGWGGRAAELLAHHAVALFCFLTAILSRKWLGFSLTALLMEVNSVFLHGRALLQLTGGARRLEQPFGRVVRSLNLASFGVFRFGVQAWQTWWLLNNCHQLHAFYIGSLFLAQLFFAFSNVLLMQRVIAAERVRSNVDAPRDY